MLGAVVGVAALSIHSASVRSQGAGSAANGSSDEDEGSNGTTTGSGSALVAPTDPAIRLGWLRGRIEGAISLRPTLGKARIAVTVSELATGQELIARQADQKMNLASNAKLLTGIAALSGLGVGFRWRTAVYCETEPDETGTVTGDLHVRGRGDPVLLPGDLKQLAHDVAARGIRTVEGKLVIDATYFDSVTEPPHFDEQPKERAAFRAPIASFAVSRGAFTVTVMPDPGGAATVTLEPFAGEYLKLTKEEVTSIAVGRTRLRVDTKPKRDHLEIEVTGQIRAGEGSWDIRRRVDDPTRFAAEVFKRALAEAGVQIRKKAIGLGPVPLTAKLVAVHESPTLSEVVRIMNKHSDNNVAESILKTLGAELKGTPGPASWADAQKVQQAQLSRFGLLPGSYRTANGSGLYASTEVTAKQLVTLLAAAHKDYRIGPDLVASLPTGGQDGTLARRWSGKPAKGRVRAKTGTLDKVTTLAGYIAVEGGRVLVFAILVNDIPPGQRSVVRAMADDMVDSLAAYLGAS